MSRTPECDRDSALRHIPSGMFVLTSRYEDSRDAALVKWVQQCALMPPMVMVALERGLRIDPVIRNSRSFALCQISADDRYLICKFSQELEPDEDPLVSLSTTTAPSGSPVLDRAMSFLDCEVVRHIELDADHRIYVGQVHHGAVLRQGVPAVRYGSNGTCDQHGTCDQNGTPH